MRDLFAIDPKRGERLAAGVYPDYSKNRITYETLNVLLQLAEGIARAHRCGVWWRENQRVRKTRRSARRPAGAEGTIDQRFKDALGIGSRQAGAGIAHSDEHAVRLGPAPTRAIPR